MWARRVRSLSLCLLLFFVVVKLGVADGGSGNGLVHTIYLTECTEYFTWQSLGMAWSHRKSGQPGPVTRVMCCTEDQLKSLDEVHVKLLPTHISPSFAHNPHNGDIYGAYNKPLAVIDFVEEFKPQEEFLLILDADMVLRRPFLPEEMGVQEGQPFGAYYGYLKGVANELAVRYLPEIAPRNDTAAGPLGRRADQVGGVFLEAVADLRKLMHSWLSITEQVRFDPAAYNLTGDVYCTSYGQRCWISEMYGYVFAAAKAGVWHHVDSTSMLYPSYLPHADPRLMHYGLLMKVASYAFDKHWHYDFDPLACPPWDMKNPETRGGLFPHPPLPSSLDADLKGWARMRDLLSIETVNTLNEAFCENHLARCPPSVELMKECSMTALIAESLANEYSRLAELPEEFCSGEDADTRCSSWAEMGECTKNPGFMQAQCPQSCRASCDRPSPGRHLPEDSLLFSLHSRGSIPRMSGAEQLRMQAAKRAADAQQAAAKADAGGVEDAALEAGRGEEQHMQTAADGQEAPAQQAAGGEPGAAAGGGDAGLPGDEQGSGQHSQTGGEGGGVGGAHGGGGETETEARDPGRDIIERRNARQQNEEEEAGSVEDMRGDADVVAEQAQPTVQPGGGSVQVMAAGRDVPSDMQEVQRVQAQPRPKADAAERVQRAQQEGEGEGGRAQSGVPVGDLPARRAQLRARCERQSGLTMKETQLCLEAAEHGQEHTVTGGVHRPRGHEPLAAGQGVDAGFRHQPRQSDEQRSGDRRRQAEQGEVDPKEVLGGWASRDVAGWELEDAAAGSWHPQLQSWLSSGWAVVGVLTLMGWLGIVLAVLMVLPCGSKPRTQPSVWGVVATTIRSAAASRPATKTSRAMV